MTVLLHYGLLFVRTKKVGQNNEAGEICGTRDVQLKTGTVPGKWGRLATIAYERI